MKKILFTGLIMFFGVGAFCQDSTVSSKKTATKMSGNMHSMKHNTTNKSHTAMAKKAVHKPRIDSITSMSGTMGNGSGPGKVTTNPNGKNSGKNGLVKFK